MGETPEHLLAKSIIAQAAAGVGWDVTTEWRGCTPSGEDWIADVFATKGKSKIAFEVQWSNETMDEIRRRQQRYSDSDVRCAWFYRLVQNRHYWARDLLDEKETPLFGIRIMKDRKDFVVVRYGVRLGEFVSGMLRGELKWGPVEGELVRAKAVVREDRCWKCLKDIGLPLGLVVQTMGGDTLDLLRFTDSGVPHILVRHLSPQIMRKYRIGSIKRRYSATLGEWYLSNGCIFCDALQGDFYISQMIRELSDSFSEPFIEWTFTLGKELPSKYATWRFRGHRGDNTYPRAIL